MDSNKNKTKADDFFLIITKPLKRHSLEIFLKEQFRDLTRRSNNESKEGNLTKLAFMEFLHLPLIIAERIFYSFANDRDAMSISKEKYVNGFLSIYGDDFDSKLEIVSKIFDFNLDGVLNVDDITLLFAQFFIIDNDMDLFYKIKEIIHRDLTPKKRLTTCSFKEIISNYNPDAFYLFLIFLYDYCPFTNKQVIFFNQSPFVPDNQIKQKDEKDMKRNSMLITSKFTFISPTGKLLSYLKSKVIGIGIGSSIDNEKDNEKDKDKGKEECTQPKINDNDNEDELAILDYFEEDLNNAKATIIPNIPISDETPTSSPKSSASFYNHQRKFSDYSSVISRDSYGKFNTTNDQLNNTAQTQFVRSVNNSPSKSNSINNLYGKSFSQLSGMSQFKKQQTNMIEYNNINNHYEVNLNYYTRSAAVRKCKLIIIDDCLFVHIFNGFSYKFLKIISLKFTFVEEIEHCETLTKTLLTRVKLSSLLNNVYKEMIFSCQDPLEMASFITYLKQLTHFRKIEDKYTRLKELYRGSLSELYLVKDSLTNQKLALKEVYQNKFGKTNKYETLLWEYDIMKYIQKTSHPNIVKVYDLYRTQEALYIVLEYIQGGNLKNFLLDNRNLPMKELKNIMFQIANAVHFLHSHGIVHRDLKPENILVNKDESNNKIEIKLIDFGFSRVFGRLDYTNQSYGTLNYASPEVLNKTPYSFKADIWSLGVIFYYIVVGNHPFGETDKESRTIQSNILNASYTIPDKVDSKYKSIIESCLQIEQKNRPKIDDIVKLLI